MTVSRYSRAAIALHWAIAALLAVQLGLGWRMVGLGSPGAMYAPFQLHKSIGISILVLSMARIAVRLLRPRPQSLGGPGGKLASVVHGGLYLFMIGGPLTGWALVSTAKLSFPTRLFGTVPWPHLPLAAGWHEPAERAHGLLGWMGAALIALHVAGALRHHLGGHSEPGFPAEPNVLARMIPAAGAARSGLAIGAAAAAVLAVAAVLPWLVYAKAGPPAAVASTAAAPAANLAAPEAPPATTVPAELEEAGAPVAGASALAEPEAASPRWSVLPGGKLGFRVMVNGEPVEGSFSGWNAEIALDPAKPEAGSIAVRIPLLSVATGDDTRDTMLKGADFFGGGPATAQFRSVSIKRRGAGQYAAAGTLSLNGVQRSLTLVFRLDVNGERAHAAGTAALDRTEFAVGKGEWAGTGQIAGKVDVTFAFDAKRRE